MLGLRLALRLLRVALTLVALIWIASFFVHHKEDLATALGTVDPWTVCAALSCVLVGLLPGAIAWQQLLQRQIATVSVARGVGVYLWSAIGKYTPGGVLAFEMQRQAFASEQAGIGLLLRIFVGTALAACLAALLVGVYAVVVIFGGGIWAVAGCCVVLLGLIFTAKLRAWPFCPTLLGQVGLPPPRPFVMTVAWMLVAWTVTGTHLAVLGLPTGAQPTFLISAYALSAIAGILFAILPGALGIRDGVLLAILVSHLDPPDAMVLALLSRALVIAGDLIGAGMSAIALKWPSQPTDLKGAFHES